jgi:ABC-type transport system substrate-binding protein
MQDCDRRSKRQASRITLVLFLLFSFCLAALVTCGPATEELQPSATVAEQPGPADEAPTPTVKTEPQCEDTFIFLGNQDPTTLDPAVVYDGSDRVTWQRILWQHATPFRRSVMCLCKVLHRFCFCGLASGGTGKTLLIDRGSEEQSADPSTLLARPSD